MDRAGQAYYYVEDDLMSVIALTSEAGTVVETIDYMDYGEPIIRDASGDLLTASAIGNPYLFTGRRMDAETGQYHYRTRQLDVYTGQFTAIDSIGIWGDAGNMGGGYGYVGVAPSRYRDPFGYWRYDPDDPPKGSIPGKLWASPFTLLAAGYGLAGSGVQLTKNAVGLSENKPQIRFGNNSIMFGNNALIFPTSAIAVGNTTMFSCSLTHVQYPRYEKSDPARGLSHRTADHEEFHTYQWEELGIFFPFLYFPDLLLMGKVMEKDADWYAIDKRWGTRYGYPRKPPSSPVAPPLKLEPLPPTPPSPWEVPTYDLPWYMIGPPRTRPSPPWYFYDQPDPEQPWEFFNHHSIMN